MGFEGGEGSIKLSLFEVVAGMVLVGRLRGGVGRLCGQVA